MYTVRLPLTDVLNTCHVTQRLVPRSKQKSAWSVFAPEKTQLSKCKTIELGIRSMI